MKIIILFILLFALLIFCLVFFPKSRQFFPFSVGTYHLLNLIKSPKDLYEPVVFEDFNFDQKGLMAKYDFTPRFFDFYALALVLEEPKIQVSPFSSFAKKLIFKGKLKVGLFYKDKLLLAQEINSFKQMIKLDNGSIQVNLFDFPIPIDDKYSKDLSIKIEVLEPDNYLSSFAKRIKILVGVNGIP